MNLFKVTPFLLSLFTFLILIFCKAKERALESLRQDLFQMIDILPEQAFNEIIPARLPAEVEVAHKTGTISRVMHDTGLIILANDKKYVLVLLSKDWEDEAKTRTFLSEISFRMYKYYGSAIANPAY